VSGVGIHFSVMATRILIDKGCPYGDVHHCNVDKTDGCY
jgi:hypothetical protein